MRFAVLREHARLSITAALLVSCYFRHVSGTEEIQTAEGAAEPVAVLSFVIFSTVLGVATYHLLAFTRVPYTAILLVRTLLHSLCIFMHIQLHISGSYKQTPSCTYEGCLLTLAKFYSCEGERSGVGGRPWRCC